MHNKTLSALSFLAVVAALLIGINIGKKISANQKLPVPLPDLKITNIPTNSSIPNPSKNPQASIGAQKKSKSTYTDNTCGFSISYSGTYLEQKSENYKSTLITEKDDPDNPIVTTCQEEIPKPPLIPEKIEDIKLDGVPGKLYHDASAKDGKPRDEVIVKHPTRNHEIFIAGFGPASDEAIASIRFF